MTQVEAWKGECQVLWCEAIFHLELLFFMAYKLPLPRLHSFGLRFVMLVLNPVENFFMKVQ